MTYEEQDFMLNNAIARLSPAVQQAVGEVDVVSEIWKIGDQNELLISEIGDICEETKKVIAGETRPENFIDNIHSKLGDENKSKATLIATEINNKILIPIRDAFKKTSMSNLVPNPQESLKPAADIQPKVAEKKIFPDSSQLKTDSYLDRSALMREIENPTAAEFSTLPYQKPAAYTKEKSAYYYGTNEQTPNVSQDQPPKNLPIGEDLISPDDKSGDAPPIIRTMPRDMEARAGGGRPATGGLQQSSESAERTKPAQSAERLAPKPEEILPEQNIKQNFPPVPPPGSYSRGKFGHGTPPAIGRRQNQAPETRSLNSLPDKMSAPENKIGNFGQNQNVKTPAFTNYKVPAENYSTPSFMPSKPGFVGGTIRGAGSRPAGDSRQLRQSFISENSSRPMTENLPVPPAAPPKPPEKPAPKPAEIIQKQDELKKELAADIAAEFKPPAADYRETTANVPDLPQTAGEKIAPVPPPSPDSFQNRLTKTDTVNDVVNDKLTKTVNIPSEKKRYVVDPYREPVE